MRKISLLLLCLLATACGKKEDPNTLKVGATPTPQGQMLAFAKPKLKEKGINLKIIEIDDYNIPNRALSEGEIDANFFQHIPFMDEMVKQFHYPITCYAKIHIEPMAYYSHEVKSLRDLQFGARIAVPNDPTNEYRALAILEREGLITLKKGIGLSATKADIVSNPRKLQIREIDAALLPRTLKDVVTAAIPTNYALQVGLNPRKDAIAIESKDTPYVNIVAIHKDRENDPRLIALREAMLAPDMRTFIEDAYHGAIIPVLKPCGENRE